MRIFHILSLMLFVFLGTKAYCEGDKEASYQSPFTLSPSLDTGYAYEGKEHKATLTPGFSLSTSFMTGSGYKVNFNAGWNFSWIELLAEPGEVSTSSLREYVNSFNLGLSTMFTDKIKGSTSGSVAMDRYNSFERADGLYGDNNYYTGDIKISFSGITNTPISVSSKLAVVERLNAPMNATPSKEAMATGEGELMNIGGSTVFPNSVYSPEDIYGYSYGASPYSYAQVVEPTMGTVNDISLDFLKSSVSHSFENPLIPSVAGSVTLNRRTSNNAKRDKWGQTASMSIDGSFWENGSTGVSYMLSRSDFDNAQATDGEHFREDFYNQISLSLGQTVVEKISLSTGYSYVKNLSNYDDGNYFDHQFYVSGSYSF